MIRSGSKGQVKLASESPGVVMSSLNKWALNQARDRTEVTCFGDENKTYVQGLKDIKGTISGYLNFGDGSPVSGGNEAILDAADGDDAVLLELVPSTVEAGRYFSGLAYLDANIEVDAKGAISLSSSFVAAGNWTRH